jgi:hypothetical protein
MPKENKIKDCVLEPSRTQPSWIWVSNIAKPLGEGFPFTPAKRMIKARGRGRGGGELFLILMRALFLENNSKKIQGDSNF